MGKVDEFSRIVYSLPCFHFGDFTNYLIFSDEKVERARSDVMKIGSLARI